MNFNKNLTFLRKEKKLSQAQIAKEFNISRSAWTNYENAVSVPSFDLLIQIADYFDVSETELIHSDLENETLSEKSKKLLKEGRDELLDTYKNLVHLQDDKIHALEEELKYYKKNENN